MVYQKLNRKQNFHCQIIAFIKCVVHVCHIGLQFESLFLTFLFLLEVKFPSVEKTFWGCENVSCQHKYVSLLGKNADLLNDHFHTHGDLWLFMWETILLKSGNWRVLCFCSES